MALSFNSVGHFFATVLHDIHVAAVAVAKFSITASSVEPVIEGVTNLVYPPAVAIERVAFALLGEGAHAVVSADAAASANGVNLTLDAALVADVKALIANFKTELQASGLKV